MPLYKIQCMKKIMFDDRYGLTDAVLKGKKTITRRLIKDGKLADAIYQFGIDRISLVKETSVTDANVVFGIKVDDEKMYIDCIRPKYKVGEVVAVAQRYKDVVEKRDEAQETLCLYKIGEKYLTMEEMGAGWSNAMFTKADLMPHHIRITNIKIERLQDIPDEDCFKEGIGKYFIGFDSLHTDYMGFTYSFDESGKYKYPNAKQAFARLINKVSKRGTWESNPYVFVYEFELVD